MGNFYGNLTIQGADRNRIVEAFASMPAYVAPENNKMTVVYDELSDSQDMEKIADFSSALSRKLGCVVLSVIDHDDDILMYLLYRNGEKLDEYNSCPGYFSPDPEASMEPAGGNPEVLCTVFGSDQVDRVSEVLTSCADMEKYDPNNPSSILDVGGYGDEIERHLDLVEALGLSPHAVGLGFRYVSRGELPRGIAQSQLVKTG